MPGILSMGEMGALALHTMLEVAKLRRENKNDWISVSELATTLAASKHTLHKVAKRLVQAGLLESSRGPMGGVKLSGDADSVSLLRVIEAVDGEVNSTGCLFARRVCSTEALCQFCGITLDLDKVVRDYFTNTTIGDLAKRLVPEKGMAGVFTAKCGLNATATNAGTPPR